MAMTCRECLYLAFSLLLLTLSNMSFAAFSSFFPPAMVGFGLSQVRILQQLPKFPFDSGRLAPFCRSTRIGLLSWISVVF